MASDIQYIFRIQRNCVALCHMNFQNNNNNPKGKLLNFSRSVFVSRRNKKEAGLLHSVGALNDETGNYAQGKKQL